MVKDERDNKISKDQLVVSEAIQSATKQRSAQKGIHADELTHPLQAYGNFGVIKQGNFTNTLTKTRSTNSNTEIDGCGTATITNGDLTLTIPDFEKTAGLKTSTHQLLDIITMYFTSAGGKYNNISISLDDFMARRKLKDKKEARKQIKRDLELLSNLKATYSSKDKRDYYDERLLYGGGIVKGNILVKIGDTFAHYLIKCGVMPYPPQLSTINGNDNPNSYFMLRKIQELKNMNVNKHNEDIISVKTLLSVCPKLQKYEDIRGAGSHIKQRIIDPFERDLDALEETISWEYCHSNGAPLTDEELEILDYDIFIDLLIKVYWKDYPDQTPRLERKAQKIEEAKRKQTIKYEEALHRKEAREKKNNRKKAD